LGLRFHLVAAERADAHVKEDAVEHRHGDLFHRLVRVRVGVRVRARARARVRVRVMVRVRVRVRVSLHGEDGHEEEHVDEEVREASLLYREDPTLLVLLGQGLLRVRV
tara:strand:+ start:540 stop:863 length:324 start_codon:yes stop_codon:yes gene_type:complete